MMSRTASIYAAPVADLREAGECVSTIDRVISRMSAVTTSLDLKDQAGAQQKRAAGGCASWVTSCA